MDSPFETLESVKKLMFRNAMVGNWEAIVDAYGKHPEAQKSKITRTGDTALHAAVSYGQVEIVFKLVGLISEAEVLKIKNEKGNTALHLAASMGIVEMCKCMAKKAPYLIRIRNYNGETPLFLAALHGNKKAFLCLHSESIRDDSLFYCRRNDGDTILHSAIERENFSLAFRIISLYPDLVYHNNEKGDSPLHLLARKPSSFKSGSRLGWLECIIYNCISVQPLLTELYSLEEYQENTGRGNNFPYPENYRMCLNIIQLLKAIYHTFDRSKQKPTDRKFVDMENPDEVHWTTQGGRNDEERIPPVHKGQPQPLNDRPESSGGAFGGTIMSQQAKQLKKDVSYEPVVSHQFLPSNYTLYFSLFRIPMKLLLLFFGIGIPWLNKIREKKEKHMWANHVLDKLVRIDSQWEYENDGRNPQLSQTGMYGVLDWSTTTPLTSNDSEVYMDEGRI